MACNVNKTHLFRVLARRGYTASAKPRPLGQPATVESKVLDNKIVVASAESQLPICRISVVFRAGSRYETYDSLGASHMLRISGGLSAGDFSSFAYTRNLQQMGVGLTVSSDRESVTYTVESTANNQECGLLFLKEVIHPVFKPWEIDDMVPRIKTQVANVLPQVRAVELLHKAAYHEGLGNSIYIPKFKIGKLSSETLQHYKESNFVASRCAIVGVGIDHNALAGFAQTICLNSDEEHGDDDEADYYGGDARKDTPGNIAHVAIAGEGASLEDPKEALAFAVLQQAMGTGACVQYGNPNGSLGKAVQSAVKDGFYSFTALNASYSDNGLFGFVVSANSDHISQLIDALVSVLKSGTVSEEDFKRGKSLLKRRILETYSTDSALLDEMGLQALLRKSVQSADELVSTVDGLTLQDVQDAAEQVASSPLSMGSVGNLGNVPYSNQL